MSMPLQSFWYRDAFRITPVNIVSMDNYVVQPNKMVKFLNMRVLHERFLDIVKNAWEPFIDGNNKGLLR